ncbi:PKD domain-containing protein [Nitrososphaera sp.]|uniref:PKD domain-containing protein n=1 Tax=Nitrososphaera sp. TaxID=1971748 RepID=UPI002EDAF2A4
MKRTLSLLTALILLLPASSQSSYAQIDSILINEVELNPPGNDNLSSVSEWVELYNPTINAINIGGWILSSTAGSIATLLVGAGTVIPAGEYLLIARASQWLDNSGEVIILANSNGIQVDLVGPFYDNENDSHSWQRYPNGSYEWAFRSSTPEASNGVSVLQPKPNSPPVANAGPDTAVDEGTTAFLDGSASYDPDSDALSYSWIQASGPSVQISASNAATTSFIAPMVSPDTSLSFTLRVTDSDGAFSQDIVTVRVRNIAQEPVTVTSVVEDQYANQELKIVFINVGQGDSTLIILPNGRAMLIDGGEPNQFQTVLATLQEHGVPKIDVVVATHPHADHMGGLIGVMSNIEVGKVIDSGQIHTTTTFEDFLDAIDSHQIPLTSVHEGDTINIDPYVSLVVLNPPTSLPEGAHNEENFNNNSVVIKMTYGEFTVIFPGDIEQETESRLSAEEIDVDVLLASHHGSRGSNSLAYLNAASPEVTIVYAGAGNPYGHPHQEALERIESSGVDHLFRTDIDGSIILTTSGTNEYTLETQGSNKTVVVPEFNTVVLIASIALVSIIIMTSRNTKWKSLRLV